MADVNGEPTSVSQENRADDLVGELFKLLPAVSGVMLALIWGLAGDAGTPPNCVLILIRVASIALTLSILASLLGLQFMVSGMQADKEAVSKTGTVQFCFFASWITFVLGCVAVIWSLFEL